MPATNASMNAWGFIGQDTLVLLGKSTTIDKIQTKVWLDANGEVIADQSYAS